MKLRLQYAKLGRLRFSSHRDFQRMLERALRRMNAPMAYSSGFHPHPKISFAGAAPTGAASHAEYIELGLVERVDPTAFAAELSQNLPDGLDIVGAVEAGEGALADRLTGSLWMFELPGVSDAAAAEAARAFMALPRVELTKMTKKGERTVDVRGAVVQLASALPAAPADAGHGARVGATWGQNREGCAILTAVVRHTTPAVRPDDVLTALIRETSLATATPPVVTRLAQGPLDPEAATVGDPFAAEHDVVSQADRPRTSSL